MLLRQEHYTEYPIQVSTTYHPKRNKILIANLVLNDTRILLDLGEYRFVSFVTGNVSQYNQNSEIYQGVIPVYILVSPDNVSNLPLAFWCVEGRRDHSNIDDAV